MSGHQSGIAPAQIPCRIRIAVLIASHNRREKTIRCLRSLRDQRLPPGVELQVVLVDDASSDGTAEAVRAEFSDTRLVHGSGDLYWNGGMRTAVAEAMREAFDFHLFLNDDTTLYAGAIAMLLEASLHLARTGARDAIVVGSTEAPGGSGLTYGGWRCSTRASALHLRVVAPGPEPRPCDTFNANCVLIPVTVMRTLGNLDPAFTHSMGDLDLGLRARGAGIRSFIAPGYVGVCESNENHRLWREDDSLPVMERWRRLLGPKGLPPREWMTFTARHGGPLWPLYWVNPYVKFWLGAALRLALKRTKPRIR